MKVLRVIISITLPIFLVMLFASLLTTSSYLQLSKGLYVSHDSIEFDHDYAIDRVMGYLNYRYDEIDFYDEETGITMREIEISHMVDVKNLYTMLRVVALISLIIAVSLSYIMYKKDREMLYKTYKTLFIGPAFFIMFVGGAMLIDFSSTFTAFHNIFFTNDDWLLYWDDVLIQLLPGEFWMVSGLIILILFSLSLWLIYFVNEKLKPKEMA